MRKRLCLVLLACLLVCRAAWGALEGANSWQRVDSRYCTMWIDSAIQLKKVNRKISTWRIRPRGEAPQKDDSIESELAAKCDTIFRRAQEVLDMYPAGIHTTIRIAREREDIEGVHATRYGHGTEAVAFYVFEENTIYAAIDDLSESVLVHEMAHCIIDHYFRVRPPRKIEEMLAMHVDAHLRE